MTNIIESEKGRIDDTSIIYTISQKRPDQDNDDTRDYEYYFVNEDERCEFPGFDRKYSVNNMVLTDTPKM